MIKAPLIFLTLGSLRAQELDAKTDQRNLRVDLRRVARGADQKDIAAMVNGIDGPRVDQFALQRSYHDVSPGPPRTRRPHFDPALSTGRTRIAARRNSFPIDRWSWTANRSSRHSDEPMLRYHVAFYLPSA